MLAVVSESYGPSCYFCGNSTLVQGVQLKMQHVQNVRRGATLLKAVEEKISEGVKFQQVLALLHSPQFKVLNLS